jgi:hypothetical protein
MFDFAPRGQVYPAGRAREPHRATPLFGYAHSDSLLLPVHIYIVCVIPDAKPSFSFTLLYSSISWQVPQVAPHTSYSPSAPNITYTQ